MSRSDKLLLGDIQISCRRLARYVDGMTYEQFLADQRTVDAVIRNIMIMGEAANHLTDDALLRFPNLAFERMVGMRNILVHGYAAVNNKVVWEVASHHAAIVDRELTAALGEPDSG